jgi:hypothetical protein
MLIMDVLIPLVEGLIAATVVAILAGSLARPQVPQESLIPIPVEKQRR